MMKKPKPMKSPKSTDDLRGMFKAKFQPDTRRALPEDEVENLPDADEAELSPGEVEVAAKPKKKKGMPARMGASKMAM